MPPGSRRRPGRRPSCSPPVRARHAPWLAAVLVLACGRDPSDVVLVGTVERTLLELTAPLGEEIVALPVPRGGRVAPGTVVAQLDPTLARADLARAEAAVAAGRTAAAVAAADLERVRTLGRQGVVSKFDLDAARRGNDEAEARLRDAEAQVVAVRHRIEELRVVSPAAGVLDQLPFDVGERIAPGAVVAVVIADGAPWVRVWLPERALSAVRLGTPAAVTVDGVPGTLSGRVVEMAREPAYTPHYALTERERVHLVYETRVELDDAASLRPGQPAEVRLRLETP